jgi:hypothetical protein
MAEAVEWAPFRFWRTTTSANGLSVTAMAYTADWNATDQIPRRAVDDGSLSRFGYFDRSDGGNTHRMGGMAEWQRTTTIGVTHVERYGFDYGLDLFSNFTYFLDDPEHGDQFEQRDDRFVFGGRTSHSHATSLFGRRSQVTAGGEVRRDAIGTVGLYRTAARTRLSTVREDTVGQTSGAAYAEVQTEWSGAVLTTVGLRADVYRWAVRADEPLNGGARIDHVVNPKIGVAVRPWRGTELYASAGGPTRGSRGGCSYEADAVAGVLGARAPAFRRASRT